MPCRTLGEFTTVRERNESQMGKLKLKGLWSAGQYKWQATRAVRSTDVDTSDHTWPTYYALVVGNKLRSPPARNIGILPESPS